MGANRISMEESMTAPVAAKPVLKWAGGKRQLEDHILARIDRVFPYEKIETYREPFAGGAAIFFALAARDRFRRAVLTDTNAELIQMYWAIRDDVSQTIRALTQLDDTSEKAYYEVRAWLPTDKYERAARTIYLNKTCYNGLYRVNRSGLFNTPYGHRKKPNVLDRGNLLLVSLVLQKAGIRVATFSDLEDPYEQDFTYFDPPYVPISASSDFTAYSADGFTAHDHAVLASRFRRLTERGNFHALLSNSHCKETLRLYKGFVRHRVAARRNVAASAASRAEVSELLVESRLRTPRKRK